MVIDIDLNTALQFVFITSALIITSYLYFKEGKKLNYEYLFLAMAAPIAGNTIYVGLLWILKPSGIIIDKNIFDSTVYNFVAGALLIAFAVVSLKNNIYRKADEK